MSDDLLRLKVYINVHSQSTLSLTSLHLTPNNRIIPLFRAEQRDGVRPKVDLHGSFEFS